MESTEKYYKLTDENMRTYGGFRWELGKWYKISVEDQGNGLCSISFFHCYNSPLLAVLLNPLHADFKRPRLFEVEVSGESERDSLKFGFTEMKLVKEIKLPIFTSEQRVRFAIYCALEVCDDPVFVKWAENWLNGNNRTIKTARIVYKTTINYAVKYAAKAAWLISTTKPTASTASVASAVDEAAWQNGSINLTEIAKRAIEDETD